MAQRPLRRVSQWQVRTNVRSEHSPSWKSITQKAFLLKKLQQFLSDDSGLETVEYAIIVGLIVGGLVLTVAAIGTWVNLQFTNLKNDVGA